MNEHDDHGHSRGAWIGVTIMLVATVIGCWGVVFEPTYLVWVGLALFAVGAVAWYLMDRGGARSGGHTA